MSKPDNDYNSYLLRLRRVKSGDTSFWISSLESTATGERRSFPTLDALVAFLDAEYGNGDIPPDSGDPTSQKPATHSFQISSDRETAW